MGGEVVPVTKPVHDPAPPQLVDCLYDNIGVEVARLSEQIEGEIRPYRSRQTGHVPGGRGRLFETFAQDSPYVTGWQEGAAEIDGAAHCLNDIQREASRCRGQQPRVAVGQGPPRDRLPETPCLRS